MGVEHKKSTAITNRDSTPSILSNASVAGGETKEAVGVVEVLPTDDANSTFRFAQIPSNARISQVLLSCDDSGTAGAMDIGIYKATQDGGQVVDANHFATAQSLATALVSSDVTHASGVYGIEKSELPLWKALGLTEDPKINYDLVGTVTTAVETQATVVAKVKYVI